MDQFMVVMRSVLKAHSAAYASGPLETGRVYFDTLSARGNLQDVRATNEAQLSRFIDSLRARLPHPVIDPGLLKVAGWAASDYGEFYLSVLTEFAYEAHFIDGWEFSSGATKEYLVATRLGITCYTQRGEVLDLRTGILSITRASEYVRGIGQDASKIESRLIYARELTAELGG
jgi:hypothetical protein